MKQVRKSVFETNSSSVHSLTFCTVEEYEKFIHGQLYLDVYEEKLITPPDEDAIEFDNSIFSFRELKRGCASGSVNANHGIKELSDGTRFAYIKYDYYG